MRVGSRHRESLARGPRIPRGTTQTHYSAALCTGDGSASVGAMVSQQVVPVDKFDLAAVERAVALGWPAVEPVIGDLLAWVQDYNWPVAHSLTPFLKSIGPTLAPYLVPILEGDDYVWQYWIIQYVLTDADPDLVRRFRPLLQRIADDPSGDERLEGLDEVAAAALGRTGNGPQ